MNTTKTFNELIIGDRLYIICLSEGLSYHTVIKEVTVGSKIENHSYCDSISFDTTDNEHVTINMYKNKNYSTNVEFYNETSTIRYPSIFVTADEQFAKDIHRIIDLGISSHNYKLKTLLTLL